MPDPVPSIRHPSAYVPLSALATGALGDQARPVTPENPVPNSEQPYRDARALLADAPISEGKALLVDCSAGGLVDLILAGGANLQMTFSPGITLLPFAVTGYSAGGTTAAIRAWVLD